MTDQAIAAETTTTIPEQKKGLGTKIVLLCVIPLLMMAILNIIATTKASNIFDTTINTLNTNADNSQSLVTANDSVVSNLVLVRDAFAKLNAAHQKGMLQQNPNSVEATRALRTQTSETFIGLQQSVATFAKTLKDTRMDQSDIQAKRINYLIRTANNLPRLFDLYAESNERSLNFLGNRQSDSATNNFIFEEASRQAVLQKTLDHTNTILHDLVDDVKEQSNNERIAFKDQVLEELTSMKVTNFVMVAIFCAFLIVISITFAVKKISNPLVNMVDAMNRLSGGELDVTIPENQKDEIGQMAKALGVFKENLKETERLTQERRKERERLQAEQQEARNKLAAEFENKVGEVVDTVASSSTQLQSTARNMNETAAGNQKRAQNATKAANDATSNVQTVASAAEELSNSINEIARQVADSSTMASNAVTQTETTNTTMNELATAAAKIGEVISLITDIAEQTNLLALNATIEAARAGDAGKGFAVVASEVKNLANQTASATEEIGQQIQSIQDTTQNAVSAIAEVSSTINHMNEVSSAIAAAVEEQGAATKEIAANVEAAAHSTKDASGDMAEVTQSAERNGKSATQVLQAAENLSSQSDILRRQVDDFLQQVRTG